MKGGPKIWRRFQHGSAKSHVSLINRRCPRNRGINPTALNRSFIAVTPGDATFDAVNRFEAGGRRIVLRSDPELVGLHLSTRSNDSRMSA